MKKTAKTKAKPSKSQVRRTFSVGDTVRWESQSQGRATVKKGQVAAVLQPVAGTAEVQAELVRLEREGINVRNLQRSVETGRARRKQESYLVAVKKKTGTVAYWPVASKLKPSRAAR